MGLRCLSGAVNTHPHPQAGPGQRARWRGRGDLPAMPERAGWGCRRLQDLDWQPWPGFSQRRSSRCFRAGAQRSQTPRTAWCSPPVPVTLLVLPLTLPKAIGFTVPDSGSRMMLLFSWITFCAPEAPVAHGARGSPCVLPAGGQHGQQRRDAGVSQGHTRGRGRCVPGKSKDLR